MSVHRLTVYLTTLESYTVIYNNLRACSRRQRQRRRCRSSGTVISGSGWLSARLRINRYGCDDCEEDLL